MKYSPNVEQGFAEHGEVWMSQLGKQQALCANHDFTQAVCQLMNTARVMYTTLK
jgi:hypothetical protein